MGAGLIGVAEVIALRPVCPKGRSSLLDGTCVVRDVVAHGRFPYGRPVASRAWRPPPTADTGHRAPGPSARPRPLLPFAAGNRAVTLFVQRESRADAATWLRGLLATRGADLARKLPGAARRLTGWSTDRQTALSRPVRAAVDGFEAALSTAGLLGSADARKVLSVLEGARTNDSLGDRLVTLFQTSADPVLGLVVAAGVPESRLRAVLQSHARGFVAVEAVRSRNPVGGLPAALRPIHAYLGVLSNEMAAPLAADVTASDAKREADVEKILTPPAVANKRAAAAAAGLPPPAFIPLQYYEDLMVALHQNVQIQFTDADHWNRQKRMDTTPGGHVEGIATEAKNRVDALFGDYGSRPAPALTFATGNLEDRTRIAGDPVDMVRYFVNEGADATVMAVQSAHNSFEDAAAAQMIEQRVIDHYSGRSAPAAANEVTALRNVGMATPERQRRLRVIDRMWPGVAQGGNVSIRAREGSTARETRGIYWGLFKTMIHEYLHTTEHPTFKTWYGGLQDSHHRTTYQEGFTDLFTLQTWRSVFPNEIAASRALRTRIQGTADGDLDMGAVGGEPDHYPELTEAEQIEQLIGVANIRSARFTGNTAVLGGGKLPR
jgi:hypothetical protein